MTTNFDTGVTNIPASNVLGQMGIPDPTVFHTYFNDFDTYSDADWDIASVGTSTIALQDEEGGWLSIANSAGFKDSTTLTKVGESFVFHSEDKGFFKTKIRLSDVINSSIQVGLATIDGSDGLVFAKKEGSTQFDIYLIGQPLYIPLPLDVAGYYDQSITLGFNFAPSNNPLGGTVLRVYGSVTNSNNPPLLLTLDTQNISQEVLSPTISIENGSAAESDIQVDYLFASFERGL